MSGSSESGRQWPSLQLEEADRHPEHRDRVRVAAQDYVGSVRVIEGGEHIVAEIDGGRLLTPGAVLDVTNGAQEPVWPTPTIPQRRRLKWSFSRAATEGDGTSQGGLTIPQT